MKVIDLTGSVFGLWTVVRESGRDPHGQALWSCRCACGVVANVPGGRLRRGDSRSCGCHKPEALRAANIRHGAASGGKLTPEYSAWMHMIERCERPENKSFADYGGRGISVAPEWRHDFARFLADMGPRPSAGHSVERLDTDGNYGPTNCKWATRLEQANNKRSNVRITIDGVTKNMEEWAREHGISAGTICNRIRHLGWDPVVAATQLPRRSTRTPVGDSRAA